MHYYILFSILFTPVFFVSARGRCLGFIMRAVVVRLWCARSLRAIVACGHCASSMRAVVACYRCARSLCAVAVRGHWLVPCGRRVSSCAIVVCDLCSWSSPLSVFASEGRDVAVPRLSGEDEAGTNSVQTYVNNASTINEATRRLHQGPNGPCACTGVYKSSYYHPTSWVSPVLSLLNNCTGTII
jgi:hypothetical protein